MSKSKTILGLDLGTWTCQACVVVDGKPALIQPDRHYPQASPTSLAYEAKYMTSAYCHRPPEAGGPVVGERAYELLRDDRYAADVVLQVKRRMGDDHCKLKSGAVELTPTEITGEYVKVLRVAAERQLGLRPGEIEEAVVTVPVDFSGKALEATREACRRYGGLEVKLIDEPVAAAYSRRTHELAGVKYVLVADLGGGTFDVVLLRVGRGVSGVFGFDEAMRDGDPHLGGLDWDQHLVNLVVKSDKLSKVLTDEQRLRLTGPPHQAGDLRLAHNQLWMECERRKRTFYEQYDKKPAKLRVERFCLKPNERTYDIEVSSEEYLKSTRHLVRRCCDICERMFQDYQDLGGPKDFGWKDVDEIYLAGGGSNMKTVQDEFQARWGKAPAVDEAPQYAVVRGAAWAAEDLRLGRDVKHLGKRRYKRRVGVEYFQGTGKEPGFHPLIKRNQELPYHSAKPAQFPAARVNGSPSLLVKIVEEYRTENGPMREVNRKVLMEDLPPPATGKEDLIEIRTDCDDEGVPSFEITFRQRTKKVDFDEDSARP